MSDPITRLNAALEGRYRIERQLGEGGMATVYLARDLKHNRNVALKVLKPELAAVVGADRFLAEIETTANLQHPHILPLFDSGEADSFLFYVMPYVEGESLRERLDREHQLPVDEAVRIASDVAEALEYAHSHGVIHRDIKPANLLLHAGRPLIADFGIALAVGAAGASRLTETGLSLGTPHYMSPEQATGDPSVGAATDIYALGCVLFEMLVGEPPYTGGTPQAVLGKIVTGEAPSASAERRSVPSSVDAAIRRALEKVPADRFGRAEAFAVALREPSFRHTSGVVPTATSETREQHRGSRRIAVVTTLAVLTTGWALWRFASSSVVGGANGSTVILMDTPAPAGVYDPATRNASGTNADDLNDLLRDFPVELHKETVGSLWDREEQVALQRPALILMHRSAFFHSMNQEFGFGYPGDATYDAQRGDVLYGVAENKLIAFLGYVGMVSAGTQFLIYSRGASPGWADERYREEWVADVEGRFPALAGRVHTMNVPGGDANATFRDPLTAKMAHEQVESILQLSP